MRIFAILLLLGCLGCMSETLTPERIPSQLEVPTLYLRLPEEMTADDYRIEVVKALCKEFAVRLYDAFDGQVYIKRFVICNPSLARETEPGMITLFQPDKVFLLHSQTWMGSPPLRPGHAIVMMPMTMDTVKRGAGSLIHEWLHAYIGLGDEYRHADDREPVRTTSCPLDLKSPQNIIDSACIMDTADHRELCRRENHNPNTDQGEEPCYEFAARVLAEAKLAYIKVPNHRIIGPMDPPTIRIEVRLK